MNEKKLNSDLANIMASGPFRAPLRREIMGMSFLVNFIHGIDFWEYFPAGSPESKQCYIIAVSTFLLFERKEWFMWFEWYYCHDDIDIISDDAQS